MATPVLDELHVTVRPVSVFPAASRGVAVSTCVLPATMLAVAGVTPTDATGSTGAMASRNPLLLSRTDAPVKSR